MENLMICFDEVKFYILHTNDYKISNNIIKILLEGENCSVVCYLLCIDHGNKSSGQKHPH